jgi:hypothetical protein
VYIYLNIRFDERHSQFRKTDDVRALLNADPRLTARRPAKFVNAEGTPWLTLSLLRATPDGHYASDGEDPGQFNLVELIGSAAADGAVYWDIAQGIASFLGWELIDLTPQ